MAHRRRGERKSALRTRELEGTGTVLPVHNKAWTGLAWGLLLPVPESSSRSRSTPRFPTTRIYTANHSEE